MAGHILILNTPSHSGEDFFIRLVSQFRESAAFKDHPIQILTQKFPQGLPENLRKLGNVIHTHGAPDDPVSLDNAGVKDAEIIIVLTKQEGDITSDGRTFDILHRIADSGTRAKLLAECVDDRNRARLSHAGAHVLLRPMRSYPEMIVRAFVAPGSEEVIENLFTHSKDEYRRYNVEARGLEWKLVVRALMDNDIGTAVAYIDPSDNVCCNPGPQTIVDAKALIVMVREESHPDRKSVEVALSEC